MNLCLTDLNLRLLIISCLSIFVDPKGGVRREYYIFEIIDAMEAFEVFYVKRVSYSVAFMPGVNLSISGSIHQGSERFITF